MIKRTILTEIENSVKSRPVTLITGARQVGKSTLASLFMDKGFSYISLESMREAEMAKSQPETFLSLFKTPLIIDEAQRAPELFQAIFHRVNEEKMRRGDNYGMYILTGSQMYRLMQGVGESLAGRIGIVHIPPLSRSELLGRDEPTFLFDLPALHRRSSPKLEAKDLFDLIVRGFYPELHANPSLSARSFYSSYVETYIERDVSELINVKDKFAFRRFMELLASLTGQELIYDKIAKTIGIDIKTVQNWLSVLLAGDIVYLLEPYYEMSLAKRITKRSKLYFSDTGLAAYLARLDIPENLMISAFSGAFVETYAINEIRKTFLNNGIPNPPMYYYRDSNQNEIDLVILFGGKIHRIEIKSGSNYSKRDIKAFKQLDGSRYLKGEGGILCLSEAAYPLDEENYAAPIAGI